MTEPLKLPEGELGGIGDRCGNADITSDGRFPDAVPIEDFSLNAEPRSRNRLKSLLGTLVSSPVSIVEDDEPVDTDHLADEIESPELSCAEAGAESSDHVANAGGVEPGDIEQSLHDEKMLGTLGLVNGLIVKDRVVEVVQLQTFLESCIRPPFAIPVGLVFCCRSAHMTEDNGMKLSGLVLLESPDLEHDSVVQWIGSPILPNWPIQEASTQFSVDLGRDAPSGAEPVVRGELAPEILPDWLVRGLLLGLNGICAFEKMKIFPNIRYNAADAMLQKPSASIETVHSRMETLHQFDGAAALACSVAIPAASVHMERGSTLVRSKGALGPPVVVFGFLGVSGELQGFEELAPVGVLADLGEVLGDETWA